MGLKLVIPPADAPVSLEAAKRQIDVEHDEHDDLIQAMLDASLSYVDGPKGYLGRAIIDQTWDYYLDAFPKPLNAQQGARPIELPLPPLIEVVGLFYADGNGDEQELTSGTDFIVDDASQPARLMPVSSWPTADDRMNAVRVRIRCGYLDTTVSPPVDNPPAAIKQAILLNTATLYRNRENYVIGESIAQLPWAAEQLLRPHRVNLGLA